MSELRLDVRKTYKLLVNGAFPRSESGRSYEVTSRDGTFIANVAQGSRKDVRDAVAAARIAQSRWWAQSAYNRGQVIYRLAEMAESRRDELAEQVRSSEGLTAGEARLSVAAAIDRVVWYAGWTDKIAQILGTSNPVAGPYFNFSVPVPSGVVGVLAPRNSSLEGFVNAILAPIAIGNSVVVLASERCPIPAILLGEMTTHSDFPAGVLNIITGITGELAPTLSSHEDVDCIDLGDIAGEFANELASSAADSIKRVFRDGDDKDMPLRRLRAFVEISTVWHTIGQ
jgi:acyl-CoA reductase-like NAD-dependent aldehyde dehydrogenase